jgi:hypothetical protein
MSRPYVEWRSVGKTNYKDFKKSHPSIKLPYVQWKQIIYSFNEAFRDYILETGCREKLPYGLGEIAIAKKKRVKTVTDKKGVDHINLAIDWAKTHEKGKTIYHFNFDTEGYCFKWMWFKHTARFKLPTLWWFKPFRTSSRLLAHYIKVDDQYKNLYKEWNSKI